jgi:hypothetical protein
VGKETHYINIVNSTSSRTSWAQDFLFAIPATVLGSFKEASAFWDLSSLFFNQEILILLKFLKQESGVAF